MIIIAGTLYAQNKTALVIGNSNYRYFQIGFRVVRTAP
jgi:hypothetical protein